MPSSKVVYVGIKGTVLALNSSSGEQLWATHLKGSDFVHVVLDGDNLYATTQGEIFCMNPEDGTARWANELRGMGFGLAGIATESAPNALLMLLAEKHRQDAAAAAASTSTAVHSS